MKFRKKPVVIDAVQWFCYGHHSEVGHYRTPQLDGQDACKHCGQILHDHGWIDTLEAGHIVCPGDWVITGVQGEHYPCKPDIFAATYEPVATAVLGADEIQRAVDEAAANPGKAVHVAGGYVLSEHGPEITRSER